MNFFDAASFLELSSTICFALAIIHSFLAEKIGRLAERFPDNSFGENFFHLLGEVEIVFGLWAGVWILAAGLAGGFSGPLDYIQGLHFTEPLFVFVIMAIAASKPVLEFVFSVLKSLVPLLPLNRAVAIYMVCLILGPLLGSLITEPAAMTVTAFLLKDVFFDKNVSLKFKHLTLATLFVNISIGGTLTHFAAPPVVMVASKWNWDTMFMLTHFGYKAVAGVVLNALLAMYLLRGELKSLAASSLPTRSVPAWVIVVHLLFVLMVVLLAHHPVIFIGLFIFFLGFTTAAKEYQDSIRLRESLLVAFFLAGLVVFGQLQGWWLAPLLQSLSEGALFVGATALTAITDNAALTYLGSQVEGLSDSMKLALVMGAVTGGGLTLIANAPNPAGFTILRASFERFSPLHLFLWALPPTLIAGACFWFL